MNIATRVSLPNLIVRAIVIGIVFGAVSATAADAATPAEVDGWLATTTKVVRTAPPHGMRLDRQTVYVSVVGANVEGSIDPAEAHRGFLKNNQEVMLIPIESGGTGAAFDALLFTRLGGRTQFVGLIPSPNGHLHVALSDGVIIVRVPIYKASDPNCCPSGFHWERDTLRGLKLVKIKEYDTRR
ncbi:MAG: LppP/LprE family lipoprotein [Candidatus Eremiobacteraeota bacterium]|nr:LppP/LprE family lipoprotein [Candidatus Eremiobacteraeota bacterium]